VAYGAAEPALAARPPAYRSSSSTVAAAAAVATTRALARRRRIFSGLSPLHRSLVYRPTARTRRRHFLLAAPAAGAESSLSSPPFPRHGRHPTGLGRAALDLGPNIGRANKAIFSLFIALRTLLLLLLLHLGGVLFLSLYLSLYARA